MEFKSNLKRINKLVMTINHTQYLNRLNQNMEFLNIFKNRILLYMYICPGYYEIRLYATPLKKSI